MGEFIQTESFKHLLAKNLLCQWMKDEEERSGDFCKVAQFSWRRNYGIHTELPFYDKSNPYYFEISGGTPENPGKLIFVPDITVFHKGTATMLFEVVHTHPIPTHKILAIQNFFDGYHVELYEIRAEEILRQTKVPDFLNVNRII